MKMASVALIELLALMYEQNMMHHVLPANGEDDVQALTCTRSKDPDQAALLPKFNFELPRTINITPIQSPFVTPIYTQSHLACSGIPDSQLQPQRSIRELYHLPILSIGRDGERLKSEHLTRFD